VVAERRKRRHWSDADRLGHDPAMRWIVGGKAIERGAYGSGKY
jgi:hypothetical protein